MQRHFTGIAGRAITQLGLIILLFAHVSLEAVALQQTARWRTRRLPGNTIEATLTVTATLPKGVVNEWRFFVPRPPEDSCQKQVQVSVELDGTPVPLTELKEVGTDRSVYQVVVPAGTSYARRISLLVKIRAELLGSQLMSGTGSVSPLSAGERKRYLASTQTYDFTAEDIQTLIATHGLRWDPTQQTDLKFAYDVLRFTQCYLTYATLPPHVCSASLVARERRTSCGGASILYAAILRANGIPARIRAGILAKSGTPSPVHVRTEVYTASTSWRTVEIAYALQKEEAVALQCFTRDPGDLFTFHIDPDLEVEPKGQGKLRMQWCQELGNWVFLSSGTADGLTVRSGWECRVGRSTKAANSP